MSDWPKYVSHKVVQAAVIFDVVEHGGTLSILVKPYGDHRVERFVPTEPAMVARAEVGGFAVRYEPDVRYPEGYRSISPRQAFLDGYEAIAIMEARQMKE